MLNNVQIEKIINENNYKLLGQIDVTNDEYLELVEYLKKRVYKMAMPVVPIADLKLSLALVQIAIRRYQDGRFWPCFEDEIGIKDVPSSRLNYIGKIFYKTIKQYGLLIPRLDDGDYQYVEYIKTHAFITDSYMQGFYDFSYAYYENNLFRQLNLNNIEEDFEDLSDFMRSTLSNKNDSITEVGSNRAAKTYRLLKSTRTAFAISDSTTIRHLFIPILKLIDNYFYDNEIPQIAKNRYESGFIEWCAIQSSKTKNYGDSQTKTRKEFSHKPYLTVDIDEETAYLVIPPQKFREEDCDGKALAIIHINGYEDTVDLEVYKSFGLFITEEKKLKINSVFDAIDITIKTLSDKNYHISASNYRIFDRSWKNRIKFEIGYNYILVKPNVPAKWENEEDELDSFEGYAFWKYYSAKINEESIFYVGNKPISIIGEFSAEPIFDRQINHFAVFDNNDKQIIATREHPAISFVVEKGKLKGTVLNVNGTKYPIESINEKICYDWPDDKKKLAVSIPLSTILPIENNKYSVLLDVPGNPVKTICEYLFLRKFDCRFNKPRYTYDSIATLTVTKGDCLFDIVDDNWVEESASEKAVVYNIPLEDSPKQAELILYLYDKYRVYSPIKIFEYGFSEISMRSQKEEYIWYEDLGELLYVKIPGAKSVSAYYGNEDYLKKEGLQVAPDTFRIDISEFVHKIREAQQIRHYINLEYEDNAKRRLALPCVYRKMEIKPYFKVFVDNGLPHMDVSIKGKSDVFLDVRDSNGEIVIERKPIVCGRNDFPELSTNEPYDFSPYIEKTIKFSSGMVKEFLKPISNVECFDLNNLERCILVIKSLSAEEKNLPMRHEYHLCLKEREDDTIYTGSLIGYEIEKRQHEKVIYKKDYNGNKKRKKFGTVRAFVTRVENQLDVSLQVYSEYDNAWRSMYYDKKMQSLVHFDDDLLNSKEISRFVELDEFNSSTSFTIDVNRIRRLKEKKDVISTF